MSPPQIPDQPSDTQDLYRLVGQIVSGRFRVLNLHRAGPRGLVYEVEPPSVGQSRRALKVLMHPEAREPEAVERLESYLLRMRLVEHPNLERVFELGALTDQTPFLLTEWLPMGSLDDTLAHGGRQPLARAVEVVSAVADGLSMLHDEGLCHGDLRPRHILVTPDRDGFSRVVVVGAGLTPQLQPALPMTVDGALYFLAPERTVAPATIASDVYALGVLGYLLLTGRHPFESADPRAVEAGRDPVSRLYWLHREATPIRPGLIAPDPSRPPAIEAVIGRALAKDPAARHPNAGAFFAAWQAAIKSTEAVDLSTLFTDELPPAEGAEHLTPPPILAEAPPDPPKDQRLLWVAAAGAALGVGAGALMHVL